MESRREEAMELFLKGYNCAQSVALAHADILGMSFTQIAKITQPLGGGLGRMRLVCGTVSSMMLVMGAVVGSAEGDQQGKKATYDMTQKLAARFEEINGSIICKQLLGLEEKNSSVDPKYSEGTTPEPRSEEYYKKRPCQKLIGIACDILAEEL